MKNGLTMQFFFFENSKNLGQLDESKQKKKKGMALQKNKDLNGY